MWQFPGASPHFPPGDTMLSAASYSYKDIQLIIKEEFSKKKRPHQLNVFFFFLSSYILSTKDLKVRRRYSKGYLVESTTDENFFVSDLCLSWISKNKLKKLGVGSKDYLPWFERFTRLHSRKTMTRCERFQWTPEAHRFFERFIDLDMPEYEEFKVLLSNKTDENSCKTSD